MRNKMKELMQIMFQYMQHQDFIRYNSLYKMHKKY